MNPQRYITKASFHVNPRCHFEHIFGREFTYPPIKFKNESIKKSFIMTNGKVSKYQFVL